MKSIILKPIASAPNEDYMAGSDGNVYSRTKYKGFGRRVYVDWYPLKGSMNSRRSGYRHVSFSHNNVKRTRSVHRLVCEAFHGPCPSRSHEVRHLDGNPLNNSPENLAWGTKIENWQDRLAHGRGNAGGKHPFSKFTDAERHHIRWCVNVGLCSVRHAARRLGVDPAAIRNIASSKAAIFNQCEDEEVARAPAALMTRCETCQEQGTVHIKEIGCHFCESCLKKVDARIAEINLAEPSAEIPKCHECGGGHEPSGARSDCIRHWKLRALKAERIINQK